MSKTFVVRGIAKAQEVDLSYGNNPEEEVRIVLYNVEIEEMEVGQRHEGSLVVSISRESLDRMVEESRALPPMPPK